MTLVARDLTKAVPAPSPQQTRPISAARTPAASAARTAAVYRGGLKRAFDILLVILAAPMWLPLVALCAAVAATDGHNPFFFQQRLGRGGRSFRLWKLRTMVPNADAKLEAYLARDPEARAEWSANQKLKHDPRITFFGRFLRKTSLDELPQLINVLKGDMSLVGPRPMMVTQKDLYDGSAYYEMRPGLTGLWQVSERHESLFSDRVRYDNDYAATMSLRTDIKVLVQTVGVVLRGTGC
ncbi:sugar transferase [Rhodobacterales bacterium HKCCE2091]|nr:sugar transferase [Rhodobacterales bacterium HKCCE2091]